MTVFRPAARVTSPDGREWEIYAYKIAVRDRDVPDPLGDFPGPASQYAAEWAVLDGILYILLLVPRAVLRLVDATAAAVRAVRSEDWTIDAVTYVPHETVYTWTTTTEYKGQVLAQVEGHLARGDIPAQLAHADYRGEDRRSDR